MVVADCSGYEYEVCVEKVDRIRADYNDILLVVTKFNVKSYESVHFLYLDTKNIVELRLL